MDGFAHRIRLELADWEVTLRDDSVLVLRAHAYGETEDHYVFSVLMAGPPIYDYELSRVPKAAVTRIVGGWTSERPLAPPT